MSCKAPSTGFRMRFKCDFKCFGSENLSMDIFMDLMIFRIFTSRLNPTKVMSSKYFPVKISFY